MKQKKINYLFPKKSQWFDTDVLYVTPADEGKPQWLCGLLELGLAGGVFYLENESITIDGVKIWGSPCSPTFGRDWAFNVNRGVDSIQLWNQIPEDFIIFKLPYAEYIFVHEEYYYLKDNYIEVEGDLGNSCMRYIYCQSYFDIYIKNPDVCKMLVYVDEDNKVWGRALIWTIDTCDEDKITSRTYMDRIYGINDSIKVLFKGRSVKEGDGTKSVTLNLEIA